jgi:hypothetical protein
LAIKNCIVQYLDTNRKMGLGISTCLYVGDDDWYLDGLPNITDTASLKTAITEQLSRHEEDVSPTPCVAKNAANILKCVVRLVKTSEKAVSELGDTSTIADIVFLVKNCKSYPRAAKCGIRAISILCRSTDCNTTSNSNNINQFGKNGAVEVIASIFNLYSEYPKLLPDILVSIRDLTFGNDNNQTLFRKAGANELVLNVLKNNFEDSKLVNYSCMALRSLAYDDKNQVRLSQLGACEYVVNALKKYSNNADIVEQSCWAVRNLSFNDSIQWKLDEAGALKAVSKAVVNCITNENVAIEGSAAIANLTYNSKSESVESSEDACKAVALAISKYPTSVKVLSLSIPAVHSLASSYSNIECLKETGLVYVLEKIYDDKSLIDTVRNDAKTAYYKLTWFIPRIC